MKNVNVSKTLKHVLFHLRRKGVHEDVFGARMVHQVCQTRFLYAKFHATDRTFHVGRAVNSITLHQLNAVSADDALQALKALRYSRIGLEVFIANATLDRVILIRDSVLGLDELEIAMLHATEFVTDATNSGDQVANFARKNGHKTDRVANNFPLLAFSKLFRITNRIREKVEAGHLRGDAVIALEPVWSNNRSELFIRERIDTAFIDAQGIVGIVFMLNYTKNTWSCYDYVSIYFWLLITDTT